MTAVLGIKGRGRTTFCRPVSSGGLGSPPARPYGGPGRLRTLANEANEAEEDSEDDEHDEGEEEEEDDDEEDEEEIKIKLRINFRKTFLRNPVKANGEANIVLTSDDIINCTQRLWNCTTRSADTVGYLS